MYTSSYSAKLVPFHRKVFRIEIFVEKGSLESILYDLLQRIVWISTMKSSDHVAHKFKVKDEMLLIRMCLFSKRKVLVLYTMKYKKNYFSPIWGWGTL